jgi:hypothetical protein
VTTQLVRDLEIVVLRASWDTTIEAGVKQTRAMFECRYSAGSLPVRFDTARRDVLRAHVQMGAVHRSWGQLSSDPELHYKSKHSKDL